MGYEKAPPAAVTVLVAGQGVIFCVPIFCVPCYVSWLRAEA